MPCFRAIQFVACRALPRTAAPFSSAPLIPCSSDGRVLDDLCTLGDYSVQAESTLTLAVPLAGGKVGRAPHFAAAPTILILHYRFTVLLRVPERCVGQTPEVAKQTDKPKRVRGRAKRRLQYNRRFKNIVVGAGGKKKVRLQLRLRLASSPHALWQGPNTQAIKCSYRPTHC